MRKVRFKAEWGEAYLFLRFKLDRPQPRLASLGVMTVSDAREKIFHNQYNNEIVAKVLHQAAIDNLVDTVYRLSSGETFMEANYRSGETIQAIERGEIFNSRTGERYDTYGHEVLYCLTQETLKKIPEVDTPELTIWQRIKSWFKRTP